MSTYVDSVVNTEIWQDEITADEKNFRETSSLVTSLFSKNVAFTKFLSKTRERKFP